MISILIALIVLGIFSASGFIWFFLKLWDLHYKKYPSTLLDRVQSGHTITTILVKKELVYSRFFLLNQFLLSFRIGANLDRKIKSLVIHLNIVELIGISLLCFIVVFISAQLIGIQTVIGFLFALLFGLLPYGWIYIMNKNRQNTLERQLPDILDFIARSMLAGHDFNGALRLAAQESPSPIANEFQIVFDEINFGRSIQAAMQDLAKRISCPDIRYFAIAVLINREIGGDIASLLSNVATLIRERLMFKNTVYAMTAEGRVSAIILGAMPFVVGSLIFFFQPGFISILWTDEVGSKMIFYALFLMAFGVFWMYRLVQIKV